MSFREKSAWASLASLLIVYVPYFAIVLSRPRISVVLAAFIVAVVVQVILLVLAHVVFAVSSSEVRTRGERPRRDERDIAIELRSFKTSSLILGGGVMIWCFAALAGTALRRGTNLATEDAVFACQVLFAGFVLANLAYYATQVIGYRRTS